MDRLKAQINALNSFLEFKKLLTNQYTPLDNKNIAWDKLCEQQQCGSVQEYITIFDNIVVALLELAKKDTRHAFIYGLKLYLKGFVKV